MSSSGSYYLTLNIMAIFIVIFGVVMYGWKIGNDKIYALSSSPSFPRQKLVNFDNPQCPGWIDIANLNCHRSLGIPSTDILTVTYSSDGNNLYSTLWLKSIVTDSVSSNINKISYGIFIDTDFDNQPDYSLEIQKYPPQNWSRVMREFEPVVVEPRSYKFVEARANYTGFLNEYSDRYVNITLDLAKVGSPEKYQILFYTEHRINCPTSENCSNDLYDFTPWVFVPIPQFSISTPQSPDIRPGGEARISVHVDPTVWFGTSFAPTVKISGKNTTDLTILGSETLLHSDDGEFVPIIIKLSDNYRTLKLGPNPVTLDVEIVFPLPQLYNAANDTNSDVPIFPSIYKQLESTQLLLNLQHKLGIQDYISEFNEKWVTPLNGIYAFLGTIAIAVISWIYKTHRSGQGSKALPFNLRIWFS
jgi:hypothetical protein